MLGQGIERLILIHLHKLLRQIRGSRASRTSHSSRTTQHTAIPLETSGPIRNPSFSIPARANSAPDGSAATQPTDSLGAVRKDEVKRPQELAFTKGFGTFELALRFSAKREANSAMAASVSEIIPLGDGRDEGDSDGSLGVRLRLREMSSGFENNGMGGFPPSVFAAIRAMVLHDNV